jgi:hypothetical protein
MAKRIDELEVDRMDCHKKIASLEAEMADLKDWAERLIRQLDIAGITPVKFKRNVSVPATK